MAATSTEALDRLIGVIQDANAPWPMQFVGTEGSTIHPKVPQIKGNFSQSLGRIAVDVDRLAFLLFFVLAYHAHHCPDILNGAQGVVDEHHAHQAGLHLQG